MAVCISNSTWSHFIILRKGAVSCLEIQEGNRTRCIHQNCTRQFIFFLLQSRQILPPFTYNMWPKSTSFIGCYVSLVSIFGTMSHKDVSYEYKSRSASLVKHMLMRASDLFPFILEFPIYFRFISEIYFFVLINMWKGRSCTQNYNFYQTSCMALCIIPISRQFCMSTWRFVLSCSFSALLFSPYDMFDIVL